MEQHLGTDDPNTAGRRSEHHPPGKPAAGRLDNVRSLAYSGAFGESAPTPAVFPIFPVAPSRIPTIVLADDRGKSALNVCSTCGARSARPESHTRDLRVWHGALCGNRFQGTQSARSGHIRAVLETAKQVRVLVITLVCRYVVDNIKR